VARYKVLKSVGHNFADSFVSDGTWVKTDYAMGHLLRRAVETGVANVSVDLMTDCVTPSTFRGTPGGNKLESRARWFRDSFVPANHTAMEYISAARMDIDFDLASLAPAYGEWMRQSPDALEPGCPYTVDVCIVDDRGREWISQVTGSQYPLKQPPEREPKWL
jgi:hypothetical protein